MSTIEAPASVTIELLRPSVDLPRYGEDVWSILCATDDEFVPCLSSRTSDTANLLARSTRRVGPIAVFDMIMHEYVFLARVDGVAVGFSSFRPREDHPILPEQSPCTNVSVTVVLPAFRRQGIASRLNEAIESLPSELASPWIARRTWSTNECNLRLLRARGFSEVLRLANHRGRGVDTIYLVRPTNSH